MTSSSSSSQVIDLIGFLNSGAMPAQRTEETHQWICCSDCSWFANQTGALTKPADDSLTVGVAMGTSH